MKKTVRYFQSIKNSQTQSNPNKKNPLNFEQTIYYNELQQSTSPTTKPQNTQELTSTR